jgi:2,4-diaminopentanoate dehydrogenase
VSINSWHPHSPDVYFDHNPGLIATAAHCVNAIPYVCAAPAGVQTSVDLPMVAGRISSRISAPRQPVS